MLIGKYLCKLNAALDVSSQNFLIYLSLVLTAEPTSAYGFFTPTGALTSLKFEDWGVLPVEKPVAELALDGLDAPSFSPSPSADPVLPPRESYRFWVEPTSA